LAGEMQPGRAAKVSSEAKREERLVIVAAW
jgi:hypothetical protein